MKQHPTKALYKQQIIIYRSIKQFPSFFQISGLPQHPHELGHRRLGGHIPALDHPLGQSPLPHLVDGEVAGLVEALGAHHHGHARPGGRLELGDQIPPDEVQPPSAEGLDDDAPVEHLEQHVEDLRVESGGELDEEHLLAQAVP